MKKLLFFALLLIPNVCWGAILNVQVPFTFGSGDGWAYGVSSASWSAARSSSGSAASDSAVDLIVGGSEWGAGGCCTYYNHRTFISADLSYLPPRSKITTAQLKLYINKIDIAAGRSSVGVQVFDADLSTDNAVVASDYDGYGSVALSNATNFDAADNNSTVTITLNEAGIEHIYNSLNGWVNFCIREKHYDVDGYTFPATENELHRIEFDSIDASGTDGYLNLTLDIPEYVIQGDNLNDATEIDDLAMDSDRDGYEVSTGYVEVNGSGHVTGVDLTYGVGTQYQLVDDPQATPDDGSTYIYETAAGDDIGISSFSVENVAGYGEITKVRIYARCREVQNNNPGNNQVAMIVYRNASEYSMGSWQDLTTSWANYYDDFTTDPHKVGECVAADDPYDCCTGSGTGTCEWDWDSITGISIGVALKADDYGIEEDDRAACTQVYGEIFYNADIIGEEADNDHWETGYRFKLLGIDQGDTFEYARMVIPVSAYAETSSINLHIQGEYTASSSDFTSYRPSQRTKTSADISWTVSDLASVTPGDSYRAEPVLVKSPDISSILNSIVGLGGWPDDGYATLIVDHNGSVNGEDNYLRVIDYGIGYVEFNPVSLEACTDVYGCFVSTPKAARVEDDSFVVHAHSIMSIDAELEYQVAGGGWTGTPIYALNTTADDPIEIPVTGLSPDTEYEWRLNYRAYDDTGAYTTGTTHTVRTQRAAGSTFTFVVLTDIHTRYAVEPGEQDRDDTGPKKSVLLNKGIDSLEGQGADFYINLGDTFELWSAAGAYPLQGWHIMSPTQTTAEIDIYKALFYLRDIATPMYYVIGNHEGENAGRDVNYANARAARKELIPNPVNTSSFFNPANSSNTDSNESYYAFEWGDALFVILDAYGYHTGDIYDDDQWAFTLGATQYEWLYDQLSGSDKAFKLVFIHNLLGGSGWYGRGGIEYASNDFYGNETFEWGNDSEYGSGLHRDTSGGNWTHGSIHTMLENYGAILFHAHDHGWARQDGAALGKGTVPYIHCPTLAGTQSPTYSGYSSDFLEDYLYGIVLESTGYTLVTVHGSEYIDISYIGTILDEDEAAEGYTHEEVRDSIRIYSRRWNPQLLGDWGVTVTGGAIQGGAQ